MKQSFRHIHHEQQTPRQIRRECTSCSIEPSCIVSKRWRGPLTRREAKFEPEVQGDLIFAWAFKPGVRHLCKIA